MRIFREYFTTKDGQRQRAKSWYLDFRDCLGRRHKVKGFSEKRSTQSLAESIESLISCRFAGQQPDASLQRRLEMLPNHLLKNLCSWGLLDSQRLQSGKLLREHLADWRQSLVAAGCTAEHLKALCPRVEKIIRDGSFSTISDISPAKVERYLIRLRDKGEVITLKQTYRKTKKPKTKTVKISKATYNHYVRAIRQFCKWLVDTDRIDKSPVHVLKKITVTDEDKRRPARTLTIKEVRNLIQTTSQAEDYRGIPGPERALIYVLANESGLRAGEIRKLKLSDFDFKALTLTVRAEVSKSRKLAVLPLRADTAAKIQEHIKRKLPTASAFNMPNQPHLMIKADLSRAGIPYKTEAGIAHFHAQRHNFATALDMAAMSAKTAQTLMRHSDPRLTLNIYTHGVASRERAAIESLPDLYTPTTKTNTGTDG
ncbi:MAG: site-specific integrase [Planctomycetes bacterium]|nr:site-specific integrase [Planctomycetota bacterium]